MGHTSCESYIVKEYNQDDTTTIFNDLIPLCNIHNLIIVFPEKLNEQFFKE